ncbi:MAG TPA: hypothetical protein DGB72_04135 [Gemmatimonadetes bacterium]|jgi:hypothetical protein|nr:hypothetical protein [Gemmatimonadota bacterium]
MATKTLLEEFVAQLNASIFLAEFAFPGSELTIRGQGKVEVADHLVLLDDLGIIFQLKERDAAASSAKAELNKWFANKVRKKAVAQVRSTRELLSRFPGEKLRNQRGHEVAVATKNAASLYAVVIFRMPNTPGLTTERYYPSRSAGFVHFISDVDWLGVCRYLITPAEIADYLAFRQQVLTKYQAADDITEAALVGQFIGGDQVAPPSKKYDRVLAALREDQAAWDMSFFIEQFGDKITYREGDSSPTSHYRILSEFAKLSRSELREFKKRFLLALDAVRDDRFELPYRLACPRTDCGFLILPVTKELANNARNALRNFSLASKHLFNVKKHISLSVVAQSPFLDIEWMFAEGVNEPNPELEALVERNNPFRNASEQLLPRYFLDSAALKEVVGESGVG